MNDFLALMIMITVACSVMTCAFAMMMLKRLEEIERKLIEKGIIDK